MIPELLRLPVIRFILSFDKKGAMNFGAAGLSDETAAKLKRLQVIDVWDIKPPSTGFRKVYRRFRAVSAGAKMPRLAMLIREELRNRNLASMDGHADGVGRVAMLTDWRERRADVKAAVIAAWERLSTEPA